jgi:transketolase
MDRLAAVCAEHLSLQASRCPQIWVLDGDLGDSYRLNTFSEVWPDRFVPCGIAEQNMVSMAAGMAACGIHPWVFSFGAFLAYRAADQIRVSVAQTRLPVALVGSHAGGLCGRNGKTHQAIGDIALVRAISGLHVWTPCDPDDTRFCVDEVLRAKLPAYIRLPREEVPCLPGSAGCLRWLTPITDNIILCSGLSARWALDVSARLNAQERRVSVLHLARIEPIPEELTTLIDSAHSWFVIEDHVRTGGLCEAVVTAARRFPTAWFGWPQRWMGGSGDSINLLESCGLTPEAIAYDIHVRLADGVC